MAGRRTRPLVGFLAAAGLLLLFYAGALLGLRVLQWWCLGANPPHPAVSILGVALLLAAEGAFTCVFEVRRFGLAPRAAERWHRTRLGGGLILRCLLWLLVWVVLIELPRSLDQDSTDLFWKGQAPYVWWYVAPVLAMTPWLSITAVGAWLGLVGWVVLRARRLRGTVLMLAPAGLVMGLLAVAYFGLLPGPGVHEVASQPGVSVIYDPASCPDPVLREAWNYPRLLLLDDDERTLFLSFGATFGSGVNGGANLWKVDVASRQVQALWANQVRNMALVDDSLFAFPWNTYEILRIDKRSFRLAERLDVRDRFPFAVYQPTDVLSVPPYLYVAMTYVPQILRFDPVARAFVDTLDLRAAGLSRTGDLCCYLAYDRDRERLWAVGGGIGRAFLAALSVDDLRPEAVLDLEEQPRTSKVRDASPPAVYTLSDLTAILWRTDPVSLQREELCRNPFFTRIDYDTLGDRLLLFDYLGGWLTIADPDCRPLRRVFVGPKPYSSAVTARGIYVFSTLGVFLVQ